MKNFIGMILGKKPISKRVFLTTLLIVMVEFVLLLRPFNVILTDTLRVDPIILLFFHVLVVTIILLILTVYFIQSRKITWLKTTWFVYSYLASLLFIAVLFIIYELNNIPNGGLEVYTDNFLAIELIMIISSIILFKVLRMRKNLAVLSILVIVLAAIFLNHSATGYWLSYDAEILELPIIIPWLILIKILGYGHSSLAIGFFGGIFLYFPFVTGLTGGVLGHFFTSKKIPDSKLTDNFSAESLTLPK